jgi:C1A family cysteine protease
MAGEYNLSSFVAAVRDAGARWQAGSTSMTALSQAERVNRLGYKPGPGEPSLAERERSGAVKFAAFRASALAFAVGAPAAFDWRNVNGANYVTPIKDQGNCGSCVSFGSCATVEGTVRVASNDPNKAIDLSEAHLFFCLGKPTGASCNNGWWVDPALDCFVNTGVADEACYPYTDHDQDCTNLCGDWQSRVTKITGWHKLTSIADMKAWLSTKGPLDTCFTVYDDFFSYHSGVYHHVSGGVAGGHCVCAVGYDDVQGCWICKNSWSTGWGDGGFFRIAYGECGIDGTMWAVDAAPVVDDKWVNNVHVVGLWTIDQDRNAWAYIDNNVGWKKISPDNDNIFLNMLVQLAAAKTGARPVNLHIVQGVIKEIYVL